MPIERIQVSWSQFCGLLEIDPARFIGVDVKRVECTVTLLLEPEHDEALSVREAQGAVSGQRREGQGG